MEKSLDYVLFQLTLVKLRSYSIPFDSIAVAQFTQPIIMASLSPKTDVLGRRLAAHLLRRTTFNISKARIDTFADLTPDAAVDLLIDNTTAPIYPEPVDPVSGNQYINCGTMPPSCGDVSDINNKLEYVRSWWIYNALKDTTAHHKFQFFLHTCFTANIKENSPYRAFDYIQKLGYYSAGSYKELAKRMTIDPLMLYYLNGNENTEEDPNENYAREFFELFTIGKGPQDGPDSYTNYTEADIVEAAKVFSGWRTGSRDTNIDPDLNIPTGKPKYNKHDTSDKTFSEKFDSTQILGAVDEPDMYRELDEIMDMVFGQDETARFICRKIYRFFISDNISTEIEEDIIEPLATTLRDNDYELSAAFKQLFKSSHFYDEDDSDNTDEIIGAKVRDPLSHILLTLNMLELPAYDPVADYAALHNDFIRKRLINFLFPYMGMVLFSPPSVAGYPPDYQEPGFSRLWFDGSTAIARYKFGEMLLENKRVILSGDFGGVQFDPVAFIETFCSDPYDANTVVQEVTEYLLPELPETNRFDYLLNDIFLDGLPAYDWTYEWNDYITTGVDTEVRLMLYRFFQNLLFTGESQMM